MSHTYRVGVIGFAHMHVNNVAALFAQHSQVDLVACADTVPTVPELRNAPVDAGIRSADSGQLEPVNGPNWAIG